MEFNSSYINKKEQVFPNESKGELKLRPNRTFSWTVCLPWDESYMRASMTCKTSRLFKPALFFSRYYFSPVRLENTVFCIFVDISLRALLDIEFQCIILFRLHPFSGAVNPFLWHLVFTKWHMRWQFLSVCLFRFCSFGHFQIS